MLKNQDIICISSIDWDFIWQANQEIMFTLANNGNRVLFVENTGLRSLTLSDLPRIKKRIQNWFKSIKGFREESENLYIYSPLLLPFPYSRIARLINRYLILSALKRWMHCVGFERPLIWTFLPTPLSLDIVHNINYCALIYYNIDNLWATSQAAKKIIKFEKEVVKESDVVFTMSKNMFNYLSSFSKNVYLIPAGVSLSRFKEVDSMSNIRPVELSSIKTKIVGYVGGIRKSIDVELIDYLARELTDFTFIFVGPLQINAAKLKLHPNIIFIGQKEHKDLPSYIRYFDVCIIPYKRDEYTNNVSPAKLNEYLALGKPVVSTRLEQVENFNQENAGILHIADNYKEFADFILKAVQEDNQMLKEKRIRVAHNNSWEKKIEEMSLAIEAVLKKKEKPDINWQEKLIKIYSLIRKKITSAVLTASILWLLVFYTPLVWFLAEPLKIKDRPQKADVIVVFAGGVGESGRPGQGYEERVKLAVELYKQGYAQHIIFSSGYTYAFKEPLVMKALAVSLGAAEDIIILEDKAKNTYENIEFTKEILEKKGWNKIILVTSSYHMRRAYLVFRKNAKEIKVFYTPIQNSLFYLHSKRDIHRRRIWKQINLQQIGGIIHEYLGILYYRWKGWI